MFLHTHSTKSHLTIVMSSLRNPYQPDETSEPPKNSVVPIFDIPNDTSNQHYYNRDVIHAAEVKYENNRYITPVNVEFGSTESDSTVNIASKHRKLFATTKYLILLRKSSLMMILSYTTPKSSPWEPTMHQNSPSSMIAKPNFPVFSSAKSSIP